LLAGEVVALDTSTGQMSMVEVGETPPVFKGSRELVFFMVDLEVIPPMGVRGAISPLQLLDIQESLDKVEMQLSIPVEVEEVVDILEVEEEPRLGEGVARMVLTPVTVEIYLLMKQELKWVTAVLLFRTHWVHFFPHRFLQPYL
jgi:hypothetical protein